MLKRGVGVALAVALLLTACLVPPERERIALGGDTFEAVADGTRLSIEVPTCNGEPEVTVLEEDEDEVRIEVVSQRQRGDVPACLDIVEVQLSRALGDRELMDLTSERTIRVRER